MSQKEVHEIKDWLSEIVCPEKEKLTENKMNFMIY